MPSVYCQWWVGLIVVFCLQVMPDICLDYETTIFAEEALHRLVEVYYKIGLVEESKKYAITLGYNYQSGEWYENSYQVFNKNYKKIRIKKQDKKSKSLIKRIKSIIVNDNE